MHHHSRFFLFLLETGIGSGKKINIALLTKGSRVEPSRKGTELTHTAHHLWVDQDLLGFTGLKAKLVLQCDLNLTQPKTLFFKGGGKIYII